MIVDVRSTSQRPFWFSLAGLSVICLWLVVMFCPVTAAFAVDVTDDVEVSMTRLRFDRRTIQSSTRVTV
ncbi:MAG: hypothetical protein PVG41_05840, partial [Desulfobacteraceae bacterium]